MTADSKSNEPAFDAPGTVGEYIEDIRTAITLLAATLLRSGVMTENQLHSEVQSLISAAGGRTLRPEVYPVLHELAQLSPERFATLDPSQPKK